MKTKILLIIVAIQMASFAGAASIEPSAVYTNISVGDYESIPVNITVEKSTHVLIVTTSSYCSIINDSFFASQGKHQYFINLAISPDAPLSIDRTCIFSLHLVDIEDEIKETPKQAGGFSGGSYYVDKKDNEKMCMYSLNKGIYNITIPCDKVPEVIRKENISIFPVEANNSSCKESSLGCNSTIPSLPEKYHNSIVDNFVSILLFSLAAILILYLRYIVRKPLKKHQQYIGELAVGR